MLGVLGALTALFFNRAVTASSSPAKLVGGLLVLVPTYSTELNAFGMRSTSENLMDTDNIIIVL